MLISKSDFPAYVNFTENIPDRILDFHIRDAEKFDFEAIVPEAFYTALSENPSPADDLSTFKENYVVPLLVCYAFQRFLLWAGRNITQYGIRTNNEDTSVEITDKARGELINDIKGKTNVHLARFWKRLKDVEYTFDGTAYDFDCKKTTMNVKISAV